MFQMQKRAAACEWGLETLQSRIASLQQKLSSVSSREKPIIAKLCPVFMSCSNATVNLTHVLYPS